MNIDIFSKKDHYILDENNNAIPATLFEWGAWFNADVKRRIVKQDYLKNKFVSTVFIGIDHNYITQDNHEIYQPHIFETMIFDGKEYKNEIYCERYSTWNEALKGHDQALSWVNENF